MSGAEDRGVCPNCLSRPRVRSLAHLFQDHIIPRFGAAVAKDREALCFAMTSHERRILERWLTKFRSVSLYGRYAKEHELGVDARDLTRYPCDQFSIVYSCLLFDYFVEHKKALTEAYRVLVPDGLFIAHMEAPRIVDGDSAPYAAQKIQPKPGYYDYIPTDQFMFSVKVGRDWFLDTMEQVGFAPASYKVADPSSGLICEWFVGEKSAVPRERIRKLERNNPVAVTRTKINEVTTEYVATISCGFPFKEVRVRLDIPTIAAAARGRVRFAHHVIDTISGNATDRVIATTRGGYIVSDDLGRKWNTISARGFEKLPFANAYQLSDGCVLLQADGTSGAPEKAQHPGGLLVRQDRDGTCTEVLRPHLGAAWHGTSSIDECAGVIKYSDYQVNPMKPSADRSSSHVYRSVDNGKTWSVVFEKGGVAIRHFHLLRADPFRAHTWWLSSGDLPSECMIWRSDNDGDSWSVVTGDAEGVTVGSRQYPRELFRTTDLAFTENSVIWGTDDILGTMDYLNPSIPDEKRTGARVFRAELDNFMQPQEVGYCGQPVRSIVDCSDAWMVLTQGGIMPFLDKPSVLILAKSGELIHLFDVEKIANVTTGFTYSCASRKSKDGTFFSVRGKSDVFDHPHYMLRWNVEFG